MPFQSPHKRRRGSSASRTTAAKVDSSTAEIAERAAFFQTIDAVVLEEEAGPSVQNKRKEDHPEPSRSLPAPVQVKHLSPAQLRALYGPTLLQDYDKYLAALSGCGVAPLSLEDFAEADGRPMRVGFFLRTP